MSSNPYNLVLRLLIEFYGYITFGFAGFFMTESLFRWPLAVIFPVTAGFLWGTFYVEDDPAGIGKAVIKISGIQRLLLEFAFYAVTVFLSFVFVNNLASFIYIYLIIVHNAFSWDRISWMIKTSRKEKVNHQSIG